MATKDSQELKSNERYPLGDYNFRIERSSGTSPNYDKIEAICTDKDGKNARKSIQVPSNTIMDGWYVEANETEATVYVVLEGQKVPIGDFSYTNGSGFSESHQYYQSGYIALVTSTLSASSSVYAAGFFDGNSEQFVFASKSPFTIEEDSQTVWNGQTFDHHYSYTGSFSSYGGKSFYYAVKSDFTGGSSNFSTSFPNNPNPANYSAQLAAAKMILGDEVESGIKLVGRFSIDLGDAGGEGPGSDWTDPGDYDPDWEEGDPTHTLYVEVTGALSGRHNDPIVDPSYSYIPSDKDTVKDYGCGGDGGHGGGGGAGASTVVVHKFATNQANSKEVTAIARRHGYGSGGGKGGKGGDGCILVYY